MIVLRNIVLDHWLCYTAARGKIISKRDDNMTHDTFLTALQEEARTFTEAIATEKGDWIIKGFIDIFQHIYTISVDTKVVSKVLELLLIPKLLEFAARYN